MRTLTQNITPSVIVKLHANGGLILEPAKNKIEVFELFKIDYILNVNVFRDFDGIMKPIDEKSNDIFHSIIEAVENNPERSLYLKLKFNSNYLLRLFIIETYGGNEAEIENIKKLINF